MVTNARTQSNQRNSISPSDTRLQGAPNRGRDRQANGASRPDRNQQQPSDQRAPKRAQDDDESDGGQAYDKSLFDNDDGGDYGDDQKDKYDDSEGSYSDDDGGGYGDEHGEDE